MKASKFSKIKWLATSVLAVSLSALAAQDVAGVRPEGCPPMMRMQDGAARAPMGMMSSFGPRGGGRLLHQLRGVNLTEEQRDKVFALTHEQAPNLRAKFNAVAKARDELHRLAASDQFDPAKARALADAQGQAVAELTLMHAQLDSQVRMLLTPEQKKALDKQDERQPRRGDRRP